MRLRPGGTAFTLLLGGLGAVPPLSIDMGLPALAPIARSLGATPGRAGLTLSLFLLGFAATPLLYGLAADRRGRRPVLLFGLALFTLGGLLAAAAPSLGLLLAARFVQGAGAGANMTVALAMIRDLFTGREAQRRIATVIAVLNVAPMVAPSLGALLLGSLGWRGIYLAMAAAGGGLLTVAASGLAETRAATPHPPGGLAAQLAHGASALARNRAYLGNVLTYALGFAAMFSYVAGSPLVLLGVFRVGAARYGALFALTALGILCGAVLNGRLARRGAAPGRVLTIGVLLALGADLLQFALDLSGAATVGRLVPLLVLATFGYGLGAPSASHGALETVGPRAGLAGGIMSTTQMGCGAAASALVALSFQALGPVAMSGMMTLAAAGAAVARFAVTPRPHVLARA